MLTKKNRENLGVVAEDKIFPSINELLAILKTFSLTVFAWVFFRAENISHALNYIRGIFSISIWEFPKLNGQIFLPKKIFLLISLFIVIEWLGRKDNYALAKLTVKWKRIPKFIFYYIIIILIFYFYDERKKFIYFDF